MKRITPTIKFSGVVLFSILLIIMVFPPRGGVSIKKANADSLDVYPGDCLGGWEDPANAVGIPDGNSAVLADAQSQLFCGSFEGSDQSQQPQAVTLYFSWSMTFSAVATTTENLNGGSGEQSWSGVLDATDTATDAPTSTASSTPDFAPAIPSSSDAIPVSTSTPALPLPPSTTSTPAQDVPATSTSLLKEIFTDPLAFLVERSFADSSGTISGESDAVTADNFLDVSYSTDGVTWQDLGEVDADNWQNFSATIPVSSWNDINSLQVKLTPLLTADPPTIYLDSMWLEVDYNPSISDLIQQGTDATLNALSDIGNAVDNAISDIIPGNTTGTQPEDIATVTTSSQPQSQTPPSPPVHRYSFQTGSGLSMDPKDLAWVPAQEVGNYDASATASGQGQLPTVTVVGENSLRVAGTCSETYYTILLFMNVNDYKTNPAAALFNEAQPCVNGSFAQTIADSDLPPQLASGTYYLVVANQPAKGPWQPFPQIYPVTIGNASSSQ
ncbi:MAG TPA: hypothetical protein VMA75_01660 [Candidatus Paceibacterota bacterium]|nr:hypothetical protein [Candidatus Paceibacterota bacterium]